MSAFRDFTHRGVDVYRTVLSLSTYKPGPADPNPPLFGEGVRAIYPYAWQKTFSTEVEERDYEAVVLTSPWLELTILPDWGFHLYRAVDRVTGRDMFHCPKIMKPAHNAIRGAYVAGGVEFNFPVGHNVMTWERVALDVRKTDEGVTALFHNVDRCSGMALAAGVTLCADSRAIRFDQCFHNPTSLPRPWYYWLNAGMTPHPSLRLLLKGCRMFEHFEGPFLETVMSRTYPVHNGLDYSRYSEIPEPVGLFSPGGTAGWFGAWYEDWDFGVARWAPPWRVAGEKMWSWGNSEEGLLWGEIAADQSLPVPELQSGRPETQMDRGMLPPHSARSDHEWWMPVNSLGGLDAASRFGAMSVMQDCPPGRVRISPCTSIRGCRLEVNGREVGSAVDLVPGRVHEVSLAGVEEPVDAIRLKHGDGTLLEWRVEPGRVAANVDTLADDATPLSGLGAEARYLQGFKFERRHQPAAARALYHRALEADPACSGAHVRLGIMDLQADRIEAARRRFRMALQTDRWNDEALYLHGLAALREADRAQAQADFCRTAATGDRYASAAITELAMMACRDRDWVQARALIDDGLHTDAGNPTLLFLRALDRRLAGDRAAAQQARAALTRLLGVSVMARFEAEQTGDGPAGQRLPAAAPAEDALRRGAALRYAECGCGAEACILLNAMVSAEARTEAQRLLAWMDADVEGADKSVLFFAWGRETRQALEAALVCDPDDVVAHFGLGCMLAELRQLDHAVEHLRTAASLAPDRSVIWTALGRTLLESSEVGAAAAALERAIQAEPPNATAWCELDRAYRRLGRRDAAWLERFSAAPEAVREDESVLESLAELYADTGRYAEAADLLSTKTFHPYELTHDLRNLWSRIHREWAVSLLGTASADRVQGALTKALSYPPNLRLGRPLRRFDARTLYTAGRLMAELDDRARAAHYYEEAAAEDQPDPTPAKPWSALAEIELGCESRGRARLTQTKQAAQRLIDAGVAPHLDASLKGIVAVAEKILAGWRPTLAELSTPEQ